MSQVAKSVAAMAAMAATVPTALPCYITVNEQESHSCMCKM